MELQKTLFGQAIQFIEPAEADRRRSPVPLIRALQDRYGFVEVPSKVEDLDFNVGVSFLRGYFKDIIIDKFQFYNNGILCEAAADNQFCADFLDEVMAFFVQDFDIPIKGRMKAFQSKLEVSSTKDIRQTFNKFAETGSLITSLLESYGLSAPPFVVGGIALQQEPQTAFPNNPSFEFARRAGQPFDAGLYYSSGPLRTRDHLKVLSLLEEAL